MDPASAIIGIISFGFTVIKEINDIYKAFKGAPEQVQALHDASVAVSLLLSRLQSFEAREPLDTPQAANYLKSLCDKADLRLKEVRAVMTEVAQPHSSDNDSTHGRPKIRLRRWITSKDRLDRIAEKLTELRRALCEMLEVLQTNHLEYIVNRIDSIQIVQSNHFPQLANISAHVDDMRYTLNIHSHQLSNIAKRIEEIDPFLAPPASNHRLAHVNDTITFSPTNSIRSRLHGPLECPPRCECRCHHPSMVKFIPDWLASYVGQISISRRLLHPTFSPWSLCNIPTCRGDLHRAMTLQWDSPLRLLNGSLQYSNDYRISFSVGARRVIPYNSVLFKAIWSGNVHTVRDLFATGRASIWDYDINGLPVFCHVCRYWQQNTNTAGLEILRLFVDAGADALLFEETDGIVSAHDSLALGCITHLLDNPDKNRPIATLLRTNSSAISVFRSLFNMDSLDALEDFLSRKRAQHVDTVGFLASLEDAECNSTSLSSVLEVIGYSPLEYAAMFSPQRVISLFEDGENTTGSEGILHTIILCTFPHLIRPSLDAGADVNIRDRKGYTPLHLACSWCRYHEFFELVRWAEGDVDWGARTPNGQTALDRFDLGVSDGFGVNQSQEELDEFRMVLVSHITNSVDEQLDGDERLHIPGAFPGPDAT